MNASPAMTPARPVALRTEAEQALIAAFEAAPATADTRLAKARADAMERFRAAGLPHRRIEEWHYTDLRALVRTAPLPASGAADEEAIAAALEHDPLHGLARARLVIADGVWRPDLSDLSGLDGVTVGSLDEGLRSGAVDVAALEQPAPDIMIDLNTALMRGGVAVRVAAGANPARPIEIAHVFTRPEAASVFARHAVTVAAGASVRIVETHSGPDGLAYQSNVVADLTVADGASLTWVKLQREGDEAVHIGSLVGRIGAGTKVRHFTLTEGGAVSRSQKFLQMEGAGADLGLSGVAMLDGRRHADLTFTVEHIAPGSTSRMLFKNAVDGEAEGAFQGKIIVDREAQKTDSRMLTRALLLTEGAEFDAKPELEIYADDVQCGHGATTGRIDEGMLFYLLSRGISRPEAETLLLQAFLAEATEALGDAEMAAAIEPLIAGWLGRRGVAEVLGVE